MSLPRYIPKGLRLQQVMVKSIDPETEMFASLPISVIIFFLWWNLVVLKNDIPKTREFFRKTLGSPKIWFQYTFVNGEERILVCEENNPVMLSYSMAEIMIFKNQMYGAVKNEKIPGQ